MNGVLIIPTGINATIGGHAGDGNPVAKLFAECCDLLITHPNVVNAADINEMAKNVLYVEGSILDRFLEGNIGLRQVRSNKILLVTNSPIHFSTINAVSAARVTLGVDIDILELNTSLTMIAEQHNGKATGKVTGWQKLVDQVNNYNFDALAIHTPIEVDKNVALNYYKNGGLNPWGGVEAKASKLIANKLNKPVAHAPIENIDDIADIDNELYFIFERECINPRIAPEAVSTCYLHCVLKGLSVAPRIGNGLFVDDIDFMITPINCVGRPHYACLKAGIPIIAVKDNVTCLNDKMPPEFIIAEDYLSAAGVVMCLRAGIQSQYVTSNILSTRVYKK